MSALYCRCHRCGSFKETPSGDDLPDNWRAIRGPMRGSGGARGDMDYTLCDDCDDALYAWLHSEQLGDIRSDLRAATPENRH